MARDFYAVLDSLLDHVSWAEGLKTEDGEPANSFCVAAMERFNREMTTYHLLHKQPKCKSLKQSRARSELLKKR